MRKLWIMLTGLMILAGCTGNPFEPKAPSTPESEENLSWGVSTIESPTMAASTIESSLDDSGIEPESAPEEAPESLRDIMTGAISVWVDGVELQGIMECDTTLLNAAELHELWPWFQGVGGDTSWTFTGSRDKGMAPSSNAAPNTNAGTDADTQLSSVSSPSLVCRTPETFAGEGGVYFHGVTDEYWIPVRWICDQFNIQLLWDGDFETVYLRTPLNKDAIPQGQSVPILLYHAVGDDPWGIEGLFVTPAALREQLEYLTENGYDPIFFSDLTHLSDYDKPILLTFDDGYDDNYSLLFPLLQEFQAKATIFCISGSMDAPHHMTSAQAKEMSDSGLVDIQSHTANHAELDTISREEQEYQMAQSLLDLARITKKIPYVLAYPGGHRNDDTLDLAPQYFDFAADANSKLWTIDRDFYTIDRIYVNRSHSLSDFQALFP